MLQQDEEPFWDKNAKVQRKKENVVKVMYGGWAGEVKGSSNALCLTAVLLLASMEGVSEGHCQTGHLSSQHKLVHWMPAGTPRFQATTP